MTTMLGRQPSISAADAATTSRMSASGRIAAPQRPPERRTHLPTAQRASQISQTMYLLVEHFFAKTPIENGPSAKDRPAVVENAYQYCVRILRSHMETPILPDETVIAEKITKHLTRREGSMDMAIRFTNLYQRLSNKSVLSNQWSSIYFLLALSQQADRLGGHQERLPLAASIARPPADQQEALKSGRDESQKHIREEFSAATQPQKVPRSDAGPAISEQDLLREVVYVFQGIDGKYMKYDPKNRTFAIDNEVSKPQRQILDKLAEMGWIYRLITDFVEKHKNDISGGLIRQSFCSALAREMTDYYRLIAILQSQIDPAGEGQQSSPLTLKRLYVWTLDPLKRLRSMGIVVELCTDLKGGALLSLIHNFVHHGDPFVSQFISNLMTEVSKPFFQTLARWVYEGELDDPRDEFYITQDPKIALKDFWELRYSLREEMLPGFLDMSLATQIFKLGKSLNFIRIACKDTKFVLLRTQQGLRTEDLFAFGATRALATHVEFLYRQTNHQALNILVSTHKLKEHFHAVNKYLLLEQGDLTQYLVEAIGKELCKEGRHIYRHDLAAALENGIRLSNARHENPDILRRLDARLLETSTGDAGWDVFCIDYRVKEPIDTILSEHSMRVYRRLSCFLWKLKRVEYALGSTWKARMKLAQNLRQTSVYPDLQACLLTWAQMNHVIVQIQYHINFEALASTWADFCPCLDDVNEDIDGILAKHKLYLTTLLRRSLLTLRKKGRKRAALQTIVDSILNFQLAHERLHRYGTALARADMSCMQPDVRERSFDLSVVHANLPPLDDGGEDEDEETLRSIREQLDECRKNFKESVDDLKEVLVEADADAFRGLIVRLNFNQFIWSGKAV
ncbi:Gamma-tubulin complex component 3 [Geranomyces variabilis]|nr:Gamma-tubulin complex component 3 [Geranomyces variabilis]